MCADKNKLNPLPVLKIDGPLTIYEVGDARKNMLEHLNTGKEFHMDLGQIPDCDTAGVQLLISAKKTVEKSGKSFRVLQASSAVINAVRLLGLSPDEALNFDGPDS